MKQHEPVSDDVKRALDRKAQVEAAEKIRQREVKKAELRKVKSGETKYSYVAIFETEAGQDILDDLKEFCSYQKSLYNDDQRQMFRDVAKNEVIHYILEKIGDINVVSKPKLRLEEEPVKPEQIKEIEEELSIIEFLKRKFFKPKNKE